MAAQRIFVVIPHFYRSGADQRYGSGSMPAEVRAQAVLQCLAGLHQNLGPRQNVMHMDRTTPPAADDLKAATLEIAICTTGDDHLVDKQPKIERLFRHVKTSSEPKELGFAATEMLADAAGMYDVYGFMEDDLIIRDPLFLAKILDFQATFGLSRILQPNRFERALGAPFDKLYIDGHVRPEVMGRLSDRTDDGPVLNRQMLGRDFKFVRTANPHSGCFFLSAGQLAAWKAHPRFPHRDAAFIGPLESAASLGLIRSFQVYKPAWPCAGYLEIEHFGNRFLGNFRKPG